MKSKAKKLYREVVILPEEEHKVLVRMARENKIAKSRVFRIALGEYSDSIKHL